MTDPIADMLTRIRNSSAARKLEVVLPMSKIKYEIGKILEKENWIQRCEIIEPIAKDGSKENDLKQDNKFREIKITLKYKKSGKPAMASLKRTSKPGLRVYAKKDELPVVLNGLGMSIISTPNGLMTSREAKKNNTGGEVICEIY